MKSSVISRFIIMSVLFVFSLNARGQKDSAMLKIRKFVDNAVVLSQQMPQEKVFVHLDNNSYYRGDKIWFQCYVVAYPDNRPQPLSRTLYVELLTPGGKSVERKVLRIENGRCHGSLSLNHLPFYSGFYEIRAYTKYMMNFGDATAYSRVIPVFDSPKRPGDFAERRMMRKPLARYGGPRPQTSSKGKISMQFFPEGGNLIEGLRSRVAFEITGKNGKPIDCNGWVENECGEKVADFNALHEGRGIFEFIPSSGMNYRAVINQDGKEFRFPLPGVHSDGISLMVDNLTTPDSIIINLRKNRSSGPVKVGVAITLRGSFWSYIVTDLTDDERQIKFSKKEIPSGVAAISVFGADGQILADRMLFVDNGGWKRVDISLDKESYSSHEKIRMNLMTTDVNETPISVPLSVSVCDGDNAVDYRNNILTDLLLMSDIKGYVHNPMQYFSPDSVNKDRNLDLLMMVRGWRRYSWDEMTGRNPLNIRYYPEQNIDLNCQVVSFVKSIPKPNVDVSVMLTETDRADSLKHTYTDLFTTDSLGRFYFSTDVKGEARLVMSVTEKGKKKDHRIILDRLFSPAPRKYDINELSVKNFIRFSQADESVDKDTLDLDDDMRDYESLRRLEDSLVVAGNMSRRLGEVVVKGKRGGKEKDIYEARSQSVAFYDVDSELDNLADQGTVIGTDLLEMLLKINPNFYKTFNKDGEEIFYKGRHVLFVIDYKPTLVSDSLNYQNLCLESIKSIYLNEESRIKLKYADPIKFTMLNIDKHYGCVVFIETYPERHAPPGRGTRRVTIEGYSIPEEFQNITSSDFLDEDDVRRTLYWNPEVLTGPDGKASVVLYNNKTSRHLMIHTAGIGEDGTIYYY